MDYSTQELDLGVQKPKQELKHLWEAFMVLRLLPAPSTGSGAPQPPCAPCSSPCSLKPPAMLQTHPVLLEAAATAKSITPTLPALVKTEFVEEKKQESSNIISAI